MATVVDWRSNGHRACIAVAILLLLLPGCGDSGPATYPVKGVVTYQGNTLPLGAVMFVSTGDNPPASASIGANGAYSLEAAAGQYRVSVIANPERQGRPDPTAEGGIDTTGFPEPKPLIPAKFTHHDTSGLVVEVKDSGENIIDLPLQ